MLEWCAGSRLTAYELVQEGYPATLVCDSAAASLMASGRVDAIVVGADRVAANGDTANKIGTYALAVKAAHHGYESSAHPCLSFSSSFLPPAIFLLCFAVFAPACSRYH